MHERLNSFKWKLCILMLNRISYKNNLQINGWEFMKKECKILKILN